MTVWFVSRHPGAKAWAQSRCFKIDRWTEHLNPDDVSADDIVLGTLPFDVAASICRKGARLFILCMNLRREDRGTELNANAMASFNCRLAEFKVARLENDLPECLLEADAA